MNSKEKAQAYQKLYPPYCNHQEAGEDLIALLNEHAREQRQICISEIIDEIDDLDVRLEHRYLIINACLDAGKKDA